MMLQKNSNSNFFQNSLKKNKKGFGDAVSTLILFIAVIAVSTGLVVAITNYVQSSTDSLSFQSELSNNKLRTSLSITNIFYNTTSNTTYVYVKNIGETKLNTKFLSYFVDGFYQTNFSTVYADNLTRNMTLFYPQDTLVIIKDINLDLGTHTIKVVSEYGVGDSDSFNI